MRFVDLLGVVHSGGGERVVGDAIDLARHAVGGLVERFGGGLREQGQLGAGQAQAVLEVARQFVTCCRWLPRSAHNWRTSAVLSYRAPSLRR